MVITVLQTKGYCKYAPAPGWGNLDRNHFTICYLLYSKWLWIILLIVLKCLFTRTLVNYNSIKYCTNVTTCTEIYFFAKPMTKPFTEISSVLKKVSST